MAYRGWGVRFGKERIRAQRAKPVGRGGIAVAADDENWDIRIAGVFADSSDEFKTAHPRQVKVGDESADSLLAHYSQGRFRRSGGHHINARQSEQSNLESFRALLGIIDN